MREQVEDHDILLCYPYESMDPLLKLLREASSDDACISIKVTLYRVAKQSKLCESLIAAVEHGKEVTVLMELRARFDEANNIAWASRLEDAGCTVIYGSEGFKVHSKICQITYHDAGKIRRITCLGTGNFNEKTARLYSDFMLLTAHEAIGEDGNTFFRNLSLSNLHGRYRHLGVAPTGLKPLVMRGLNREIERARAGEDAQVFMKMNSLTDRDVIDKIAEACQAGVRVIMIVRGICCIRAGVPGHTEGLIVRQIVGRFLEHTRMYAFGASADTIYLSSADMMTRNTEHRVEIAYPVLDDTCRRLVVQFVNIQLADNVKARQLDQEGTWRAVVAEAGQPSIDAQALLLSLAMRRAQGEIIQGQELALSDRIRADLSGDQLRKLAALPTSANAEDALRAASAEAQRTPDDEQPEQANEPSAPGQASPAEVDVSKQQDVPLDAPSEDATAQGDEERPHQQVAEEAVAAEPAIEPDSTEDPAPSAFGAETRSDPAEDVARPEGHASRAIEPHSPGRFQVAFRLLGMGVRELFTGRISREARMRGKK
jgi:polyphosphate kinase